jgi:hypothetical protein
MMTEFCDFTYSSMEVYIDNIAPKPGSNMNGQDPYCESHLYVD